MPGAITWRWWRFAGTTAEVLLPPTRSLVQTKRRLAGLPGGGGTPLAAGLQAAHETGASRAAPRPDALGRAADRRARQYRPGWHRGPRAAATDADRMARASGRLGVAALVVDTANRPQPALRALAGTLGAPYLALPRADAERLSEAVTPRWTAERMEWTRDGKDWPNAAASRFIACRPHRWHVQETGRGPTMLLLHGAGGATQSWRGLFPRLADWAHVVAPDMPGQGFSRCGSRSRLGVTRLAEDVAALMRHERWAPDLIVGHSAGAVLSFELAGRLKPQGVVAINAALGKFEGMAGWLFPMMARALALNPLAAPMLARMPGSEGRVRELLEATGSRFDARTFDLYHQLATDRSHVAGTIAMMAAWNIDAVLGKLESIDTPTLLLVGGKDGTVPPEVSTRAAARLPAARVEEMPDLGHLMHEEAPDRIATAIRHFAVGTGTVPAENGANFGV